MQIFLVKKCACSAFFFFWPGRAFCSKKCYGRALRSRLELLPSWLLSDLLCVLLNHSGADCNSNFNFDTICMEMCFI
jgi:hypothetical protein